MSPRKSATKKSAKHSHHSPNSFRNNNANIAYFDHYKNASIVMERSVDIRSLEHTFILEVFKERTWNKLLKPSGDRINRWVKGREFAASRESIQELLEIRPVTSNTSLQFDERKEKLEPLVQVLGEIEICGHIYHLFVKCIKKRKSRLTLPFPSLVMSLISRTRIKIPSGLLVIQREESISEHTMHWSKAYILGLETSTSQIPRDEVEDEAGNTEDEIDRFTHGLEDTPQPSSQT
ncbi:hypothetical protein SO802_017483 [Lithocarpus litseifolius]|uniref:Uncharacterized protein n=1 Tax=Lithocarpus litseifolius TaxID=425828 RepID=A0AAW2CI48_9ROSI